MNEDSKLKVFNLSKRNKDEKDYVELMYSLTDDVISLTNDRLVRDGTPINTKCLALTGLISTLSHRLSLIYGKDTAITHLQNCISSIELNMNKNKLN